MNDGRSILEPVAGDARGGAVAPEPARDRRAPAGRAPVVRWALVAAAAFAVYVLVIVHFQTETARRSTAPPWWAWTKLPAARDRAQVLWLLPPVAVYAGWVACVRRWIGAATPPPDRVLLPLAVLFVLGMNVTTAMIDGGPPALWAPFDRPGHEYFFDVPRVVVVVGGGGGGGGARAFLHDYVARLPGYGIHTRTHPPGAVLFLWAVAKALGPSIRPAALAAVAVTALAVVPAFLLVRRLFGGRAALFALAMYVVTPGLVLFGATSMDGVFMLLPLVGAYALVRAIQDDAPAWAAAGGLALAGATFMTFATVCLGLWLSIVVAALAALDRSTRRASLRAAVVAGVVFVGCFALLRAWSGYDLLASLAASRQSDHYVMRTSGGVALARSIDISADNLAAFFMGVGVAAVPLWLGTVRDATLTLLPTRRGVATPVPARRRAAAAHASFAATVLILGTCGLFTHETERIWIMLAPLAVAAAADGLARRPAGERWPTLERVLGLLFFQTWVFQVFLNTLW